MSVPPLEPWVNYTRKAILWVGFGWPAVSLFLSSSKDSESLTWSLIGITFMGMMFMPVALLAGFVLPTYKLRIFGVPLALILAFWWKASQSATYNGFNLPPPMMLWISTFTAITLLIPQSSSMVAFVARLFRRET